MSAPANLAATTNPYESDRYLAEYLLFHFGKDHEVLPWENGPRDALGFVNRTAGAAKAACPEGGRALDVGCAVGGATFALADHFDEVTGIDFSASFIHAANQLLAGNAIDYPRIEEGDVTTTLLAEPPAIPNPEGIRFQEGDATDLPPDLGSFDCVHAANLICRLPEPMHFLNRVPSLVKPGGALVLATPCTWLEEYTPREKWLGGYSEKGTPVATLDRLKAILEPNFVLETRRDEPFLIREHARKYQWSVSLLTTWRRKANS